MIDIRVIISFFIVDVYYSLAFVRANLKSCVYVKKTSFTLDAVEVLEVYRHFLNRILYVMPAPTNLRNGSRVAV